VEPWVSLREGDLKVKKIILAIFLPLLICFAASAKDVVTDTSAAAKDSLYSLKSHWKNQDGQDVDLKSFAGSPTIVAMTYTGCKFSCPMTLNKLQEIEAELKKQNIQKYQIVVVSFDTERDKPAVLKAYMEKRKLDSAHWSLLSTSSDGSVRMFAVLLSVNYQKMENGEFSHSNGISLLDPSGRLVLQLKGLGSDPKEFIEKLASYDKKI
jgi:protein SCO1/2